jgi:hypothetical protein
MFANEHARIERHFLLYAALAAGCFISRPLRALHARINADVEGCRGLFAASS